MPAPSALWGQSLKSSLAAPGFAPWPSAFDKQQAYARARGFAAGSPIVPSHYQVVSLTGARHLVSATLARAMDPFVRGKVWERFGYMRLEDHAAERFSRTSRWARDLAALGSALARLPGLERAMTGQGGGRPLGRVAALLVGRVADPETLAHWVEKARNTTVRQLRREISRQGEVPDESQATGARSGDEVPSDEAAEAARPRLGLRMPRPLRASWDECFDLYRAVDGWEAPARDFVDALVAEASSDPGAPLLLGDPAIWSESRFIAAETRRAASRQAEKEEALALRTDLWANLPVSPASLHAERVLHQLSAIRRARNEDPHALEARIRALLAIEDEIDRRIGNVLDDMDVWRAWGALGFSCAGHYAEEFLGIPRRTALERLQVERQLKFFPVIRAAYEKGAIGLKATLEVVRVLEDCRSGRVETSPGSTARVRVDRALQRQWLRRARSVTLKRLRDETRVALRHFATRGRVVTGADLPRPLTDRDWHASLHRPPGVSRERVLQLGRAAATHEVADAVLRLSLPLDVAVGLLDAIASKRRQLVALCEVDRPADLSDEGFGRSEEASGRTDLPSVEAARLFSSVGLPVPAWVGVLSLLEGFVEVWDPPPHRRRSGAERIYERDGWRCSTPGCTSRRNLHAHHIVHRSLGGGDEGNNLVAVCAGHHLRGEHQGVIRCEGRAPLGLVWRLGPNGEGGVWRNERRVLARGAGARRAARVCSTILEPVGVVDD